MTFDPTFPTPTIPKVSLLSDNSDSNEICISAEAIYCITEDELQPGAFVQRILFSSHHLVSIWSNPIVAVPMNFTGVPDKRSALHFVRVLTRKASACMAAFLSI